MPVYNQPPSPMACIDNTALCPMMEVEVLAARDRLYSMDVIDACFVVDSIPERM